MSVTLEQLEKWLGDEEDEHLEFKEAKRNFHFEDLVNQCRYRMPDIGASESSSASSSAVNPTLVERTA